MSKNGTVLTGWFGLSRASLVMLLLLVLGIFFVFYRERQVTYYGYYLYEYYTTPYQGIGLLLLIIVVAYFSYSYYRFKHPTLELESTSERSKTPPKTEELPEGVWAVCPRCGAWISTDKIEYCICGARLPIKYANKRQHRTEK